ncbi:aminoglycoside phosphotransferase family protein [Brachybacterium sp. AOP42-C2-15]|uniref:aminoglycoside phosphotransferase family protein n=1 Tax=unclassified Brachybacterium TaxID=2623841 RepID=UPI003F9022A6
MHLSEVLDDARARPWAAQPWARDLLDALPDRLRAVLSRWELTVVRTFADGAELPVLEVHGRTTGPAVLKLSGHGSDHAQQVRILQAADGRGYVRVLEQADDLRAVLLERLGPSLWASVPDPVAQSLALADLLPTTWELPVAVGAPFTPAQKATSLLALVDGALESGLANDVLEGASGGALERASGGVLEGAGGGVLGGVGIEPGEREVLERARALALELIADPSPRQVVLHGDPHPGNVLRRGPEHVFIDPDGFLGEPEYDLGVALRDHQRVIDDLDHREGVGAGRRWHARLVAQLAERLELDAERTAAWAGLERVTTAIHLAKLGWAEESRAWLRTAQRMLR